MLGPAFTTLVFVTLTCLGVMVVAGSSDRPAKILSPFAKNQLFYIVVVPSVLLGALAREVVMRERPRWVRIVHLFIFLLAAGVFFMQFSTVLDSACSTCAEP